MTDRELMQQALYALEYAADETKPEGLHGCECPICVTISALDKRLAQPEQEPVPVWELQEDGWDTICDGNWLETLPVGTKLYTTPPQRPWVGLTFEEVKEIIDKYTIDDHGFDIWCDGLGVVKAVDDKLRSKNT